ncbi:MAG: esterase/lipase family protein [Gemmataceae bacterium]
MLLLTALLLTPADPAVKSLFVKAGPNPFVVGRAAGQTHAVVLVHGLSLHPFSRDKVTQARPRSWQQPTSPLVHALAKSADVYAFAYSQTVPVERVAEETGLARSVEQLKKDGYTRIVLIGHSAGGLIARQLVEDHPACGVTRVIQVNAPNGGSGWATIRLAREVQTAFFTSLSVSARERLLGARKEKALPAGVEFGCVVGTLRVGGDGVVSCRSQWTEDLQKQGVPAFLFTGGHRDGVATAKGVELLTKLATDPLPRWEADKVAAFRKGLIGK